MSRHEAGYSMIELIVVMVITAILLGIGLVSHEGAQRAGTSRQLRTVSRTYHEALTQYANDNGGRSPAVGDARGWPNDAKMARGPVDKMQMDFDARYIKSAPDSVADGRICLMVGGMQSGGCGSSQAVITVTVNPTSWRIESTYKGTPVCTIDSSGATSQTKRC